MICSLLALLFGAAGLVVLMIWLTRDHDRECFERIWIGMPHQEADALLTTYGFSKMWAGVDDDRGEEVMRFTKDEGGNPAIVVVFSVADRRVTEKVYVFRAEPGFFDRLFRIGG